MNRRSHTRGHGGSGDFLERTAKVISNLEKARARVQQTWSSASNRIRDLNQAIRTAMDNGVRALVPDIKPATISRLQVKVPGFLSSRDLAVIAQARDPKIPLMMGLFDFITGNAAAYCQEKSNEAINALRNQLVRFVNGMETPPEEFGPAATLKAQRKEQQALYDKAQAQLEAIDRQITGLKSILQTYADGRPVPPKLDEAVTKASTAAAPQATAAGASPIASSSSSSAHEFDYVNDVLIPQMFWNSVFDRRGEHYHEHHRWDDTSYDDHSTRWNGGTAQREEGGTSSMRIGDSANRDEGTTSMRMADAGDRGEGTVSMRMADSPVIAEPFGSREQSGNTSVSLGESHADRSDPSPGTKY